MTPSRLRERLAELGERVDAEEYARVLQRVRGYDERERER